MACTVLREAWLLLRNHGDLVFHSLYRKSMGSSVLRQYVVIVFLSMRWHAMGRWHESRHGEYECVGYAVTIPLLHLSGWFNMFRLSRGLFAGGLIKPFVPSRTYPDI